MPGPEIEPPTSGMPSGRANHYTTASLITKHKLMDNKTRINAILFHFAKAFDEVPHRRLLSKLTSYGITGNTHNWITSFLSNQKPRVSVNRALSDTLTSQIRLFADDSIIISQNKFNH